MASNHGILRLTAYGADTLQVFGVGKFAGSSNGLHFKYVALQDMATAIVVLLALGKNTVLANRTERDTLPADMAALGRFALFCRNLLLSRYVTGRFDSCPRCSKKKVTETS